MSTTDPSLKDQPLLVSGVLPKTSYANLQEFVEDLAKVLRVPVDLISVIQGANGKDGQRGQQGYQGTKGDKGDPAKEYIPIIQTISIPDAASYVNIPVFTGWESSSYVIGYNGQVSSANGEIPDFDPGDGVVGVGSVVAVYSDPEPTLIRCYFVFAGGITATPNANFKLTITSFP
jgi:hypothetical protein